VILGPNPESGIFMVAWLNSLAILFIYLTGRDMFDQRTGLLAALLMCVSPWAIIFSRKIWPQCYLPFTSAIIIFSLYRAIKSHKPFYFLIGGFALGASLQLHPTAFFIIPVILILLLINRSQIYSIFIVVLGVFAGYFPILIFDVLNDWVTIQGYLHVFLNVGASRYNPYENRFIFSLAVLRKFFEIAGGTGIQRIYGEFYPSNMFFLDFLSIEMILLVAYFLWIFATVFKNFRRKNLLIGDNPHLLLGLWLIVPLILHLLSVGATYHHYFIVFYPANFLAIAAFMNHFLKDLMIPLRLKNFSLRISTLKALIGLIILFHLITITAFLSTMKSTGGTGHFGTTLENKKAAVKWIISDEDFHDYRVKVQVGVHHTRTATYYYLFKINGKEMSEGKPLNYYYILDMKSNISAFKTLDKHQGSIFLIVRFGSVTVIKTKCQ